MQRLTDQDDGKHVAARVGDVIEIALPENATTGYRWSVGEIDQNILEALEETADYRAGAIGTGGTAIMRFRVRSAGAATLQLKYWRHWEGDSSIVKRFSLSIDAA